MSETPENILQKLILQPAEDELVEFKDRKTMSNDDMGKYFSALSNEANLHNKKSAWIVFGVTNKPHKIVNTNYKDTMDSINELKHYVSSHTTDNIPFLNVHEIIIDEKRVLMFEIPAAKRGFPTKFKGHTYGREGDSTIPLSSSKYESIVRQGRPDWSAEIVKNATIDDLDPKAIKQARDNFKERKPEKANECDKWDDITFLNKLRITLDGKITRTALILLGKEEKSPKIPNTTLQIRWVLRDSDNSKMDGEVFGLPFILSVDKVCAKIRNLSYEFFKKDTIIPEKMETYDPATIREAVNNCIAHQDYEKQCFVTVVEYDQDRLLFVNAGSFIPGSIDAVIADDRPPQYYRNKFLMDAMMTLGMVDTMGSGIIRMFKAQRKRMFAMPEYEIKEDEVRVTIGGKVIDSAYANVVMNNKDLGLDKVIMLDKVQKKKPLNDEEIKILRKKKLIEGRKPNFEISVSATDKINRQINAMMKNERINNRNNEKRPEEVIAIVYENREDIYRNAIIEYIIKHGSASRAEINLLLIDSLPIVLTLKQKYAKISNIIASLSRQKRVINVNTTRHPVYKINE